MHLTLATPVAAHALWNEFELEGFEASAGVDGGDEELG
ncbi:hypothetical protein EVA_18005 [gut metagenome]|uniref:Uncharacterized protein n=1 Tax=gut metagenome TaxID=749906 RepID=J9FWE1_9ZZZZ